MIVVLIGCDDADLDLFAEPAVESVLFHIVQVEFGSGDEATDAFQISHNAGFYDPGDLNFEICAFFFVFAELVPGQNFVGFFCGEKDVALAVVSADHEHTKRCVYDRTALVSILHIGIHHRRFPGKVIGIHIRCRAIILYAHPAIVGRAGDLYCRSL